MIRIIMLLLALALLPDGQTFSYAETEEIGICDSKEWALINLILCVTGVLSVCAVIVWALVKKIKRKNNNWLELAAVMNLIGVILFILTENINSRMVLVDVWTIVAAGILSVEMIFVFFFLSRVREVAEDVI